MEKIKQNIIIDTDMGNDDILAICLMLLNPNINIIGFSTVNGVSNEKKGAENLQRILSYLGYSIPIYIGLSNRSELFFPAIDKKRAESLTLLKGLSIPKAASEKSQNISSSKFENIISSKNLTIVALGPLTTISKVIKRYEGLLIKNKANILMMGRGIYKGNVPPRYVAEYNIALDPISAKLVFNSLLPVTMLGIDVTQSVPCTDKFKKSIQNLRVSNKLQSVIKSITVNNEGDFNEFYDPLVAFYLYDAKSFSAQFGKLDVSLLPDSYAKTVIKTKKIKDTVVTDVVADNFYSYLRFNIKNSPKYLYIFDLDETIVVNKEFYKNTYSKTLDTLIKNEKGEYGVNILNECRYNFDGKGELALLALNIPFKNWAGKLVDIDVSSITINKNISRKIKDLDGVKVLYTGSPRKLAVKLVKQIGLSESDFDEIVAWEDETFPLKWTSNQLIYKYLSNKYSIDPRNMYSIGNDIDQDVLPIVKFGGTGILIGNTVNGTIFPNYKNINIALEALVNLVID